MTADEVLRLVDVAKQGRELLGRLTVVKEQLAWLDGMEPIYVAFDRGASKLGSVSTQRVPIDLPELFQRDLRRLLSELLTAELAAITEELERLNA